MKPAVKLPIGIRRLLQLAVVLDNTHAEQALQPERPRYNQGKWTHPCGTPACSLGNWAFANPARWVLTKRADPVHGLIPRLKVRAKRRGDALSDAQKDFKLDFSEAYSLFSGSGCAGAKTAQEAANFVRLFVARKLLKAQPLPKAERI